MAGKNEFWEAYRRPEWQRKRLEIMQRDRFECCDCGTEEKTLNVHHAYYKKGKMPWEYPSESLSTLCEDCHEERHGQKDLVLSILSQLPQHLVDECIGYLKGAQLAAEYGSNRYVTIGSYEQAIGICRHYGLQPCQGVNKLISLAEAKEGFDNPVVCQTTLEELLAESYERSQRITGGR